MIPRELDASAAEVSQLPASFRRFVGWLFLRSFFVDFSRARLHTTDVEIQGALPERQLHARPLRTLGYSK